MQWHSLKYTWMKSIRLCYLEIMSWLSPMMEAYTLWMQPSLKSISSCCFPPSSQLSSPVLQISCTSLGLFPLCDHNSLWSGFLTCVQIGKLQDAELSLVRFMWSQGACGRWGVGEVLAEGVGSSKEDISPACTGLTLLKLPAWLTLTAAVIWKGPQFCAALEGFLPSHPSFVSVFTLMLFFSLCPHCLICIRGKGVSWCMRRKEGTPQLTSSIPSTLPPSNTLCLIHPGQIEGEASLLRGAPAWDGADVSGRTAEMNSMDLLF